MNVPSVVSEFRAQADLRYFALLSRIFVLPLLVAECYGDVSSRIKRETKRRLQMRIHICCIEIAQPAVIQGKIHALQPRGNRRIGSLLWNDGERGNGSASRNLPVCSVGPTTLPLFGASKCWMRPIASIS